jgi:5,10-methylenetetrahydromethanopterin reductase
VSQFEFGVGLFPTEPLQKMIHLAKVSEEVGFSHIWVGDSHLIWREAYINMAAMALNTTKVKLGTGVTNPLTRHPSVSASGYATLEEYAPGRMIVGIGLGDSSVETMGMKPSTLANFEKSLEQMRQILDGKEAELPTGTWFPHVGSIARPGLRPLRTADRRPRGPARQSALARGVPQISWPGSPRAVGRH